MYDDPTPFPAHLPESEQLIWLAMPEDARKAAHRLNILPSEWKATIEEEKRRAQAESK